MSTPEKINEEPEVTINLKPDMDLRHLWQLLEYTERAYAERGNRLVARVGLSADGDRMEMDLHIAE